MGDDRNFRYCYYEKAGIRGVDERKSLEILIREKPHDLLSKLSQFTQRFTLPSDLRKHVWSLLLDVITPNDNSNEFIVSEHHLLCTDLIRALHYIFFIDRNNTSNSKLFVLMFFLEFDELNTNIDMNEQFERCDVFDLLSIADVLNKQSMFGHIEYVFEDTYWIFRNLICAVRHNYVTLIETYEKFIGHLAQEDKNLHYHLVKNGVIVQSNNASNNNNNKNNNNNLKRDFKKLNTSNYGPIITWFLRIYSGIIHQNFLIRIFDKLIGALIHGTRPFIVLTLVGKQLLQHSRLELLQLNSCEEIKRKLLAPLSLEESEKVITAAFSSS